MSAKFKTVRECVNVAVDLRIVSVVERLDIQVQVSSMIGDKMSEA